jgi:putative transposase
LSTKLIRENQVICLEDLNVKGMVKKHPLAKAITDAFWSEFGSMRKYESEWEKPFY